MAQSNLVNNLYSNVSDSESDQSPTEGLNNSNLLNRGRLFRCCVCYIRKYFEEFNVLFCRHYICTTCTVGIKRTTKKCPMCRNIFKINPTVTDLPQGASSDSDEEFIPRIQQNAQQNAINQTPSNVQPVAGTSIGNHNARDIGTYRCGVCIYIKSELKLLQCGHGVCNGCYSNLISSNNDVCPFCKLSFNRLETRSGNFNQF